MITFKPNKIVLQTHQPSSNPTSTELAKVVMSRMGLDPRKTGSTDKMYRTLLELYERAKFAHREKKPEEAVMTVEEMGMYAGITRQTMYDYLRRWLDLNMIIKTSYIKDNKVIIGYKLNGSTLEQSFDKAAARIAKNLDETKVYVQELQKLIKNEKISMAQKKTSPQMETEQQEPVQEEQPPEPEPQPEPQPEPEQPAPEQEPDQPQEEPQQPAEEITEDPSEDENQSGKEVQIDAPDVPEVEKQE